MAGGEECTPEEDRAVRMTAEQAMGRGFRGNGRALAERTDPGKPCLTRRLRLHIFPPTRQGADFRARFVLEMRGPLPMKIRNSLRSLRTRHRGNRLVRRKGRVYIINKTNRRFKARQG